MKADESAEFDVAQICLNGHVISSAVHLNPLRNAEYCEECGKRTIVSCPSCDRDIQGALITSRHSDSEVWDEYVPPFASPEYTKPGYCKYCGAPFPWLATAIAAAREFLVEASEVDQDASKIEESLAELSTDTPKTAVAALRIQKIVTKLGTKVQESAIDLIAKFATEMAAKLVRGEM